MVYIAPIAEPKSKPQKTGASAARSKPAKLAKSRPDPPAFDKRKSSVQVAEEQAADAKRILKRERDALLKAKLTVNQDAAPSVAPQQASQSQDLLGGHKSGQEGYSDSSQRQQHQSWHQQKPSDKQQAPPKQHQAAHSQHMPRSAHHSDHASDLASVPPDGNSSRRAHSQYSDAQPQSASGLMGLHDGNSSPNAQGLNRDAQPQFMAGLMGMHGLTTPEEKRWRENKQKQYARELDEQVHLKQAARSAEQQKDRGDALQELSGPASMSRQPLQHWNQPSVPAQQAQQDTNSSHGQDQHAGGQHASSQQWQTFTSQYGQHPQHGQHAQHVQYAQRGEAADGNGQHQQGRIQSVDGFKAAPAGRGFRQGGGEGVAAVLASGPPANMFSSPAPQGGRRGFMAGVAELKAGPTQQQQDHARLLRERLLADLQEQTEQRRRAEAARKAAEAAAEAKQEADIAAYHARLREQEADKQHQHSLGRDNQPAATGAVRVSPPESLSNSWNAPEGGLFGHHGPSIVPKEPSYHDLPRHSPNQSLHQPSKQFSHQASGQTSHHDSVSDQATQGRVQHGRRQGRPSPSSPSPAQSHEGPQTVRPNVDSDARPDSAAYKAKVGGMLAELQAEQARLREVCSQQNAAMQELQRQAQQAAKQHGMPPDLLRSGYHQSTSPLGGNEQHQQIPAWHGNHGAGNARGLSRAAPHDEQEEGDSLDAFVETRLVPVSLSQIPDRLPDHDTIDFQADDALTQHQKDEYQASAGQRTKLTQLQKRAQQSQQEQHSQQQQNQQQQRPLRDRKPHSNAGFSPGRLYNKQPSKQASDRPDASPKKRPAGRPRIWMC